MIRDRFGQDQHEYLIRQLFQIKQTSTVREYVDRFAQLVDQLNAYQSVSDPLYYTMKVLDGLREDIKSMVVIQRLKNLDAAFSLAKLQDEMVDASKRVDSRRSFSAVYAKPTMRGALPLPAPPRENQNSAATSSEDKHIQDTVRSPSSDEKLHALRKYRRARGLCEKCAAKWKYGHKCEPEAQLHAM